MMILPFSPVSRGRSSRSQQVRSRAGRAASLSAFLLGLLLAACPEGGRGGPQLPLHCCTQGTRLQPACARSFQDLQPLAPGCIRKHQSCQPSWVPLEWPGRSSHCCMAMRAAIQPLDCSPKGPLRGWCSDGEATCGIYPF